MKMAKIFVDDKEYEIKGGKNLLEVSLSLGLNLPYFCWHPAMGSVGACRQCAVKQFKDENDKKGRLVMACLTQAVDGVRVSIEDEEARQFRAGVIEGLMTNHPHDCPVCDEGGECHLQDMTVMTGHNYRHYEYLKRTFRNQDLGPLVNQEMNRCIQCYRCTRFYNDYAGGHDFGPFVLRDIVFFGRQADGTLESEFSGNLVEVCPTGVFTDKTMKTHFTRKWDLTTAPSICVNCGLGCNTIAGERYGVLRRIRNRYNSEVNGYFLCDRGRYGYEFVNDEKRIRYPNVRKSRGENPQPTTPEAAMKEFTRILSDGRTIGIGSPRASLESNFALRTLVGADNFFSGMNTAEHRLVKLMIDNLTHGPAKSASLKDVRAADAVLVVGEDLTNTAPLLDLAIRQAARNKPMEKARKLRVPDWDDKPVREIIQDEHGPVFVLNVRSTKLDEIATATFHGAPDDIARLGFAVAHEIDGSAPKVSRLAKEMQDAAKLIALALKDAKNPLVVSGFASQSETVVNAAADVARALCKSGKEANLAYTMPEVNSFGLGMMGAGTLDDAIELVSSGSLKNVVVLENDLFRRDDAAKIRALFVEGTNVVVLDSLFNDTSERATLVLPAATFAESNGTFVNNEGRAQRFFQVFPPNDEIKDSWKWIREIMVDAERSMVDVWRNYDAIFSALADALPAFTKLNGLAPAADFREVGQKIPRETHRYSGRTAILANINVSEPKPPDDPDTPFTFTMEGYQEEGPSSLIPRYWAPGWNSVQSLNRFQEEVGGSLRGGDPGIRLVEPDKDARPDYFKNIPPGFTPAKGEWLIVPLNHIFGSEEMSAWTPGILQLAPPPYIALNPEDAKFLGAGAGSKVEVNVDGQPFSIALKIDPSLRQGTAGLPVGLPSLRVTGAIGSLAQIRKIG